MLALINVLRKITVIVTVITALSMSLSAQEKGQWAVGANFVYGHEDLISNYGFGVKGQVNVSSPVRLEANYMSFFKKNHVKIWSLGVNVHYLFHITEDLTLYPLSGLGYLEAKNTYYSKTKYGSDIAFYLGGGLDYKLAENLFGNVELKYEGADDWNRILISAGVSYRF